MAPDGALVSATRKVHIPVTVGYYEDRYFIGSDGGFPVVPVDNARFGFPTCWDQWFPELSRAYSLAGAEVLVYPTAIGSEPDHPGFDTEPLWHAVIVGQGIAQRHLHGRGQPHRHRGPRHRDADHVLRLVVRQRSLRPGPRPGSP